MMCSGTLLSLLLLSVVGVSDDQTSDPQAVFAERLMPIFKSENPSSCVQCHLSSVDLKDYILPSSRETFLSLREQGLIDTQRPRDSKILHLITMGESDADARAVRIHAKTRQQEYEAFAHWIETCCEDTALLAAKPDTQQPQAGPVHSDEVIRFVRKDRVLDSFVRNVWSQRMRCFPCHTPAELDDSNPLHEKPIQRHRDFVDKYGARMDVFKETPEDTLRALIQNSRRPRGDRLPLINVKDPRNSLLLRKPTARLPPKNEDGEFEKPSSRLPVSHMGGIKMHEGDHSYKAFLTWLEDYSASVSGRYESEADLPADNWFPTQHVVRIKGVPKAWPSLARVQIFVHRWDAANGRFHDSPAAFTQTLVTPRRMLNGTLFLLADDTQRTTLHADGAELDPGNVELRLYVDHENRLESSPTLLLNDQQPDATARLEARFRAGFRNADVVDQINVRADTE